MITLKHNVSKIQNYATSIQIAVSFILKLRMFMKTLQIMLKKDLIYQIMKSIDHYQTVIRKM